ncbi:MAG: 4Fe-4S binding protein [Candidatus Heimdallarchaeaceae archaeon]
MAAEDPKQLTVISGKGGVGKSSIISALASHMHKYIVLADADVDAADLYLIFSPEETKKEEFVGGKKAHLHKDTCIECFKCYESCRFNAITEDLIIDPLKCEGCGLCYYVCPVNAITLEDSVSGYLMVSKTRIGTMVHARLTPGEENSGKLVTEVRTRAREIAAHEHKPLVLIDGSPGIGCPVISSITGSNLALIVTEPTISGVHDLGRAVELVKQFHIPFILVINKSDINDEITAQILQDFSSVALRTFTIPNDLFFTKAMLNKKSVLELDARTDKQATIQTTIKEIAQVIKQLLKIKATE